MRDDDFSADDFRDWIGREQVGTDIITPELVRRYNAVFSLGENTGLGDVAPPTIHWCLAQPTVAADQIGEDGHPARGLFLPPIPLKRRMWAGSKIDFFHPMRIGDTVRCLRRLIDIELKTGSSGRLVFVTFANEFHDSRGLALAELQDIVYLDPPIRPKAKADIATDPPVFTRSKDGESGTVMMFRYSAITFNSHRIHYDLAYAQEVEGYPGLVVQGPMQAAMLLHFAREGGRSVTQFSFTSRAPLFCGEKFALLADDRRPETTDLGILKNDGTLTMSAVARH